MYRTIPTLFILILFYACGGDEASENEASEDFPAATKEIPEVEANRLNGSVKTMSTVHGSDSTISYYNKEGYIDSIRQFKYPEIETMIFKRDKDGWITSVTYLIDGKIEEEMTYEYTDERRKIVISYGIENITSQVKYNQKGRKIYSKQKNQFDVTIETHLDYDEQGRVVSKEVHTDDGEITQEEVYTIQYNDKNAVSKEKVAVTRYKMTSTERVKYESYRYDEYDNWVYRIKTVDDIHKFEESRYFTYYE